MGLLWTDSRKGTVAGQSGWIFTSDADRHSPKSSSRRPVLPAGPVIQGN